MNIAFTGGSTGGHVFPIRSLIQYIQSHPQINSKFDRLYRFGEADSMESRVCSELMGEVDHLTFETVISGKVRREQGIKKLLINIVDLIKFVWGVIVMVVRFPRYHIDIVFCKGGFVSLPLTIAAYVYRTPIYVHESDTRAGLATRICSRLATTNFAGFEGVLRDSITVGQIMSADLIANTSYNYGESDKTNLLIMGGSLGAKAIYQCVIELAGDRVGGEGNDITRLSTPRVLDNFNIIIILGALNADMAGQFEGRSHVISFADQKTMGELYARADVCICRGGTTSLAEMQVFSIRKLIIPLPITHDQVSNAQYHVDHYDDQMILQDDAMLTHIQQSLHQYVGYHKGEIDQANINHQVNHATSTIIDHIIASSKEIEEPTDLESAH